MDISTEWLKSDIHTWIYPWISIVYPRQAWLHSSVRGSLFKSYTPTFSGVFRGGVAYLGGGTVRCPPLARPWNFFTGDFIWKGAFLPFSSKNCKIQQCLMVFCVSKFQKNGRICGFHWTFRSKKCFSFRGASPPWPLGQGGEAPGPRVKVQWAGWLPGLFVVCCGPLR